MKNYYEILQVNKKASQEIIAKVYKTLAKKYHPDANPNNKEESEKKFKEISEAYDILSDEAKRAEYDQELEEFESESNEQTVSLTDFIALQSYCKELEQKLQNISYRNSYSNDSSQNYNNSNTQSNSSTYSSQPNSNAQYNYSTSYAQEKAYQDALNKAYHDAYINNLKNMGYKIKYQKTFKEQIRNFFILGGTIIFFIILFKIIWEIPALHKLVFSNLGL